MGNVIGLLEAQDIEVQDVVEAVDPPAEAVLLEPTAAIEFEALPDLVDGESDDLPPEEFEIVAAASISFGETDFGALGLGELESSVVLDGASATSLSLLGVDPDGGLLDSLFTSTAISGLVPGSTLPFAGLPGSAANSAAGQDNANALNFGDLLPSTVSVVSFPEALPPSGAPPVEVTPPGGPSGFGPLDTAPVVIAPPMPSDFDVADLGLVDPNLPVF